MLLLLACSGGGDTPGGDSAACEAPEVAVEDHTLPVGETLSLSVDGAVLWDTGDGVQHEGASLSHAWAEAGNYAVVVQVEACGDTRSTSFRVSAHRPAAETAPTWSGTLAWDGEHAWVVTPEADTLARVSRDGEAVWQVTCETPRTVAVDAGDVWVACESGVLAKHDASGLVETVELPTNSHPYGVAARDGVAWVTLGATGEVAEVVDGEVTLHAVGPDPRGLALGSDGSVYVTRFRSDGQGEVYQLGGESITLALDTDPDSDTTTAGVPNLLQSLPISPDGGTAFVPMLHANVLRGRYLSGEDLTYQTMLRGVLGVLDLEAGVELRDERKQLDDQDRVVDVAFQHGGNYVWAAHPGTGMLLLLDAFRLDVVSSILDAGEGLRDVHVVDDSVLLVHAWLDRELRAYDVAELTGLPVLLWSASLVETEPLEADVLQGKQLFHESADTRLSKDGYIACASCHPDGRPDGQVWDTTDRGEGLRNTAALVGRAGTGMGALHWSANFDEVQDFERDLRDHFAGTGLLSDEDWEAHEDPWGSSKAGLSEELDALAAYLESLDATPPSPHEHDAEGEALFYQLGCDTCHPAPLYTDSALDAPRLYDVGTLTEASGSRLGEELTGIDTPTLLGVWDTAPYLHDGSAATLEDAIERVASGLGQALEEEELEALARFVRSL